MRSLAERHHHHAGGRQQQQREVLGAVEPLADEVAGREQHREQRRDEHDRCARTPRTRRPRPCPLIAWYGPSSRTTCHTIAVHTPDAAIPATAMSTDDVEDARRPAHERSQQHDRERGREQATARARSTTQSIGGTASGLVGALLNASRQVHGATRPVRGHAGTGVVVGGLLNVGDEIVDRRLHAVEHRLRIEAEEQAEPEQRHDGGQLAERDVAAGRRSRPRAHP